MKTKGKRIAAIAGVLAIVLLGVAAWLSYPHLRFWYLFESVGVNAQGYREYRHRQTGIIMVRLPGGKFWMGAQAKDPKGMNYDPDAQDDEGPVHEVTLSLFMIGKYEVTQGQWKAAMGSNPSEFKGDETRPVENVSWDDIQRFEAKTGLQLPTEAEWEYACRATATTPIAGTGKIGDMGWYDENGGNTTHPVGRKAPNGFGLYDVHGNVWEWCEDVYDERFYGKAESASLDPVSRVGSENRVFRGGSGVGVARRCRSSDRSWSPPAGRSSGIGFRVIYFPLP